MTFTRKFEEILIGNMMLEKFGEETFKLIELEELKEKMLKANLYVIELEKNGEKYYIEWADMKEGTGKLDIVCTDDIREAITFSDLEEGKKAVANLNSKGGEVFKIKPLIVDDKPVKEDDDINEDDLLKELLGIAREFKDFLKEKKQK